MRANVIFVERHNHPGVLNQNWSWQWLTSSLFSKLTNASRVLGPDAVLCAAALLLLPWLSSSEDDRTRISLPNTERERDRQIEKDKRVVSQLDFATNEELMLPDLQREAPSLFYSHTSCTKACFASAAAALYRSGTPVAQMLYVPPKVHT